MRNLFNEIKEGFKAMSNNNIVTRVDSENWTDEEILKYGNIDQLRKRLELKIDELEDFYKHIESSCEDQQW